MSTVLLNTYKATYKDGASTKCNAQSITDAIKLFTNSASEEPEDVERTATGMSVVIPESGGGGDEGTISFTTEALLNDEPIPFGLFTFPTKGIVSPGDTLFLSAYAVDTDGIHFDGWYVAVNNLADWQYLGNDYTIPYIVPATEGIQSLQFQARFYPQSN